MGNLLLNFYLALRRRRAALLPLLIAALLGGLLPAAEAAAASLSADRHSAMQAASNPFDKTINILILGSDREPGLPNWRTDVMMIVMLDTKRGEAGVISLPRDIFLEEIPGHKPNRINVVDYLGEQDEPGGGPALLGSLIEEHMGIPIDHFVRFDFDSFREVVDALGGVDVEVDCPFTGYLRDYGGYLRLTPGVHHLNGNQALIYVRDRQFSGGDLDRARRQQRFVWSVRNQVLSRDLVRRLPALYSALSDSVDTDLGLISALRIARTAVEIDLSDIHGFVVTPPDMLREGWRLGMSVFIPDWELIQTNAVNIFDEPPFDLTNTPAWCQ